MSSPGETTPKSGTRTLLIVGPAAVAMVLAALFFGRDIWLRRGGQIQCEDGVRGRIDTREFNTRYWAYAMELEGSLADKAKLSGKLEPKQLQQLSESMQSAKEFQKLIVNGYNACAITKQQFATYSARFHALDGLSAQMTALSAKSSLDPAEQAQLTKIVDEYVMTARGLSDTK